MMFKIHSIVSWKIITLLFGVFFIACNQENPTTKSSQKEIKDSASSDNNDIIGRWSLCATSSNEMMTQMNTCKTIVFNINGTGQIENSSLISETFVWSLKKSGMKIINNSVNTNSTFADTFYYADFAKRDDRKELIIRHKENSFYLTK